MYREIVKGASAFDALKFCIAAMGKAKNKGGSSYRLDLLRVEEGKISSSDGHRLHLASVAHDIAPGSYRVERNSAAAVSILLMPPAEFPDYQSVIFSCALPERKTYFLTAFGRGEYSGPYTEIVRRMNEDLTLAYEYVTAALPYANEVFSAHGPEPVYLADSLKTFEAFIMPRKLKEKTK